MDTVASLFVQPLESSAALSNTNKNIMETKTDCDQRISLTTKIEHPVLTDIMSSIEKNYESFRYTVYRCGSKFSTLQKRLHTANMPFKVILAIMGRHGLSGDDSSLMIPPFQLTSLVHDIYFACERLGYFSNSLDYDLGTATSVLSNFLWNIFDPRRHHSISLLEIKITLLLLSKTSANFSEQLSKEFFNLLCDRKTKCVTKFTFGYFIDILAKIFTYIGEGTAYGAQNGQIILSEIFNKYLNPVGLSEHNFLNVWRTTQTHFLIYANVLMLIKRLEETEKLIHNNECYSCKMERIIGIRFKCSKCKNLSLCLTCFANGFSTNNHGTAHRMYEVFTEDRAPRSMKSYFANLCGLCLFKSNKNDDESKSFCNLRYNQNQNENNQSPLYTSNDVPYNSNEMESMVATTSSKTAEIVKIPETTAAAGARVVNLNCNQSVPQTTVPSDITKDFDALHPLMSNLSNTASNACMVSERLQSIIDRLVLQNAKVEQQLKCVRTSTPDQLFSFLCVHKQFLNEIIHDMRHFYKSAQSLKSLPSSSTPNQSVIIAHKISADPSLDNRNNLTHSINGADIHRSYLNANRSDFSINDVSLWFDNPNFRHKSKTLLSNQNFDVNSIKESSILQPSSSTWTIDRRHTNESNIRTIPEKHRNFLPSTSLESFVDTREANIANFRNVLSKLKDMMEDTFSDNCELIAATENFENVLDSIINCEEETRRKSA